METRWHTRALSVALLGGVVILLPILAVLQYRWIGQLSAAEGDRMRANLQTATGRFVEDFDAALGRVSAILMPRNEETPDLSASGYADRYARWSSSASFRDLIRRIYVASPDDQQTLRLTALDAEHGRFVPVEWPQQLEPLHSRLESSLSALERRPRPAPDAPGFENVPALVAAQIQPTPAGLSRTDRPRRAVVGFAIAELNMDVLWQRLVPDLVQRYFAGAGGLDYQVEIVSGVDPQKVLFRSEPVLSESIAASADATAMLLGPRDPGPGASRSLPRRSTRWEGPPGGGPPPRGGRWLLLVQHRAGSLEAAVGEARRRNLAVSSLVLILMGTTIALLVVSARRAQRLAQLQMQFVAGVSHELRTPLTVICSAADNLADGVVSSPPQVQSYGAAIRNEGRRLSDMVEQILAFAGAQAGRLRPTLQPIEIDGIIDRAISACGPVLRESACQVEKHIQPDLPAVMGDPTSLTHCLRNLLHNALKYGKENEWIGVRAELSAGDRGPELQISVADHGPGIEPDDLPHVFEPFYRGRSVVASQVLGTGLGLSLVKQIIEAHRGRVKVTSTVGQGSCFTLYLPVAADLAPRPS